MVKKLFALVMAVVTLCACTSQKKADETAEQQKVLVLYYSQTGTTKAVAEEIQQQLGADIEEIELVNPYDGTFEQTIARCQEEKAAGELPELKPIKANIDEYDVIFLGYPIWFGTYAQPIASLVGKVSFEGKKVVPFCTFGSGGLQSSANDLKVSFPTAEIAEGYGVRTVRVDAAAKELNRFLIERGYKEGEIEALPAFMEEKPVTDAEIEIFNQACSDYQYPLGTPVTVAGRTTPDGTEYQYTVNSKGADGSDVTAQIYVIVGNEEGAKPEFTQVVR